MSRKRHHTKTPLIDVVVATAGRFDMLTKCLDILYREAQSVPLTISIVDIDSPPEERIDNSSLFVYDVEKDPARNVTSYTNKRFTQNVGFPTGANDGARLGRAPLIMFIGDDVELGEGALAEVVNTFRDETVGIVGIKLMFPLNSKDAKNRPAGKIQHVGLSLNIRGEPIHPLVGWSPTNPRIPESHDAWAVTGACFTIRRELFNKAGGFDTVYGKGTFEDCDLCLKVRQLGKRVYLNAKAYGYHYVGASTEKRREGFPLQQNLQIFQLRWGQSGRMEWGEHLYW